MLACGDLLCSLKMPEESVFPEDSVVPACLPACAEVFTMLRPGSSFLPPLILVNRAPICLRFAQGGRGSPAHPLGSVQTSLCFSAELLSGPHMAVVTLKSQSLCLLSQDQAFNILYGEPAKMYEQLTV